MMELFHGPTLAFKDYAMQVLGRLFDHVLQQRGERITIVGATSGDTGSAAIEACRDRDALDIFILFPHNRASPVQQSTASSFQTPLAKTSRCTKSHDSLLTKRQAYRQLHTAKQASQAPDARQQVCRC